MFCCCFFVSFARFSMCFVVVFANLTLNPKVPWSACAKDSPHIKQGHFPSLLVYWTSSDLLCFFPLRSYGFKAFPFPVCGCLTLFGTVGDEVIPAALISVSLVSVGAVGVHRVRVFTVTFNFICSQFSAALRKIACVWEWQTYLSLVEVVLT